MAAESVVRIVFLGDSAQAVRSVERLEGAMGGLGRTGKLLAGAVGIALVGALAGATKAAIDFQSQMELIHTQAGASAKEVDKMSKALLQMAASVGQTPDNLAKGLFHVESAGFRGAKALAILHSAAKGAAIGHADLESTVNSLVGVLKSGAKGTGDFDHAMALLNATIGSGNMRLADLNSALATGLASAAAAIGIPLADVGAALGELTDQGQGATASATRLQMAFLTMAHATSKGKDALKSIGITQFQLATDMRTHGLIFALQDLEKHLKDSGKTANEQQGIIADVFGNRSLKAILPLLKRLDDVVAKQQHIKAQVKDYAGAWESTQHTVQFQLDRAKAAIIAAAIPIGQILLPAVTAAAKGVADLANSFSGILGPAIKEITGLWHQFVEPVKTSTADIHHHFTGMEQDVNQGKTAFQQFVAAVTPSLRAWYGALRTAFDGARQIFNALRPVLSALAPEFKVAFGLILLEARVFATVVGTQMRIVAAVIGALAPIVARVVQAINAGFGAMRNAAGSIASGFATAFHTIAGIFSSIIAIVKRLASIFIQNFGSIASSFIPVISSIQTLIGWIQKLIGWIDKIPSFVHTVFSSSGSSGPPGGPRGFGPGRAAGGFIPGAEGAPVQILAHAGEVVLNKSQQAVFGGPGFFQRMFGWTGDASGRSFAAGGIVGGAKRPHHGHPVRPRYKTASRRARGALKNIDHINQEESDLDRAYGQLTRQYQIDGTLDTTEIDSLIAERNKMLALLEEEKEALVKAIKDLKKAIAAMVAAIKAERKQIAATAKKMADEQKKKKPNAGLIAKYQNQITAGGTRIGNLQSTIGDFQRAVGDENLNLNHQLPFDVRDVQLDISELQQERSTITAVPGPDVAALLAQIAQLNLALSIQGAQEGVIGSFAKGTLSVPETGLALLHAGEQIVPAGQVRNQGDSSGWSGDVHISLSGPLEPLAQFITATVDTPQMADRIGVHIGRNASARARSGRH